MSNVKTLNNEPQVYLAENTAARDAMAANFRNSDGTGTYQYGVLVLVENDNLYVLHTDGTWHTV